MHSRCILLTGRFVIGTQQIHRGLPGALLNLSSWTKAFRIYQYDPSTKQVTDTKLQPAGPYDNPENIESVEVKAKGHDGTLVPLSITSRKGIKLDGSNPTWLEGYGAYGMSYPPFLEPTNLAWFDNGGEFMPFATCEAAENTEKNGTPRGQNGSKGKHLEGLHRLCAIFDQWQIYFASPPGRRRC